MFIDEYYRVLTNYSYVYQNCELKNPTEGLTTSLHSITHHQKLLRHLRRFHTQFINTQNLRIGFSRLKLRQNERDETLRERKAGLPLPYRRKARFIHLNWQRNPNKSLIFISSPQQQHQQQPVKSRRSGAKLPCDTIPGPSGASALILPTILLSRSPCPPTAHCSWAYPVVCVCVCVSLFNQPPSMCGATMQSVTQKWENKLKFLIDVFLAFHHPTALPSSSLSSP